MVPKLTWNSAQAPDVSHLISWCHLETSQKSLLGKSGQAVMKAEIALITYVFYYFQAGPNSIRRKTALTYGMIHRDCHTE